MCEQWRLWRECADAQTQEPLLVAYAISTIISWAGSYCFPCHVFCDEWKCLKVDWNQSMDTSLRTNMSWARVKGFLIRILHTLSGVVFSYYLSRLMRLWHLSPSVNSIFKRTCAAINWDYTSDFWSDPSSTSIPYVCEQRRLWWDCADEQSRLSLRCSPMR